jgi:hypothetical protein
MNAQLEQDVRHALAVRAAELPSDASAPLLAVDYGPRAPMLRPALALAAVTAAAGAILAISLIGLGNSTPRAFAGWTPAPTAARSDQVTRARSLCRSQLTRMSRLERPGLPRVPAGAWHAVLIDTRGPYTLILSEAEDGRATSVCFIGSRRQGSLGFAAGAGIAVRPPAPVAPGRVTYDSSGSSMTLPDEGSRQLSSVAGRTGPGVTGVTIRLNNGTRVTASRAKGWFLAWWPGSHGIRATEVSTTAGTKNQ